MYDLNKIFHKNDGYGITPDISELILALASKDVAIEDKYIIWDTWVKYRHLDDVIDFFDGVLFNTGSGISYFDVLSKTEDHRDFYEIAMSLAMANIDSRAYYLMWILNYGYKMYTNLVKEAFDYDPDTIHSLFPDIEKVFGL